MDINFYKIEDSQLISYYYYAAQVSNNDLLELNGFKIRNILSIVFNSEIKDKILENLFSADGTFLTTETKDNLFKYLSKYEIDDLKNHLNDYLDYQIESGWYKFLIQVLNTGSINTIVIPTLVLNNNLILSQLNRQFPKKKFVDWSGYNGTSGALFLDYNHAWKKRNIFNVCNSNVIAVFLKHFFENTYNWKIYSDDRHLFNRMNTPTRGFLVGEEILTEIKEKLTSFRPQISLNEWDVLHEIDHKNSFKPQEEIIIYFNSTLSNKYRLSSYFLLVNDNKYIINTAKDLVSNPDQFEKEYGFSNLENIISQIDLSKLNKAIEKDTSISQIIQPLWNKFNLNEQDGRLWKQLLKRKINDEGLGKVFSEIENILKIKQFVSKNTFENAYCNPENATIIPREKKVFKAICQYLKLPREYRAAMHRERNLIGGHSEQFHRQLKEIIIAIVENGLLDKHKNDDELLEHLSLSIEKIESKVDMEYFGFTRESLLYTCIALYYEILDKMKIRPIFKIEFIIST